MSKGRPEQQIIIRSLRKDPPDLTKLGRALIQLAIAQAQAEDESVDVLAGARRERGTLVRS